jgi:hypothetical protein
MPVKRTELAPVVVERVATRLVRTHDRIAKRIRILVVAMVPLGAIAVSEGHYATTVWAIAILLGSLPGSRHHRQLARKAERFAELVRPDNGIVWSQIENVIEGRTAHGSLVGMVVGRPEPSELIALPAARVVERDRSD